MAQRHGTVTVMYCPCIGVCVHLSRTTALQEGTAAQRRACQALVDLGEGARAWYKPARYIFEKSPKMAALYRRHSDILPATRTFTRLIRDHRDYPPQRHSPTLSCLNFGKIQGRKAQSKRAERLTPKKIGRLTSARRRKVGV